jgi:hypothetical protein
MNPNSAVEIETGVQARCKPGAAKMALRDLILQISNNESAL